MLGGMRVGFIGLGRMGAAIAGGSPTPTTTSLSGPVRPAGPGR